MSEMSVKKRTRRFRALHRGRIGQVGIYFGKLLRMFVYQSDWKVLPMSALIAGLVGMVIRRKLFINMEGTLMGAFALVCVCIWNGCFNSIQSICRERSVIKREHRSGMHISSYIFSHMLYQALLCLAQTGITLYLTRVVGVKYPAEGLVTQWLIVDMGISMFLITYASDMMSLWISSLSRTTTTAMTIMPFVLIFQLVFSGGMLTLPSWTQPLTHFTISNPGLKIIAAQADTNNRPFVTISDMIGRMRDSEIGAEVTVGQILDLLEDRENPAVAELRATQIGREFTLGELNDALRSTGTFKALLDENVLKNVTVGEALEAIRSVEELKPILERQLVPGMNITVGKIIDDLLTAEKRDAFLDELLIREMKVSALVDAIDASGVLEEHRDMKLGGVTTVGAAADWLAANPDVQAQRDRSFAFKTTLGKVLDIVGEEKVRGFLEQKAAAASYKADYEHTVENVVDYWLNLVVFVLAFALLATITLEFIDKDKR